MVNSSSTYKEEKKIIDQIHLVSLTLIFCTFCEIKIILSKFLVPCVSLGSLFKAFLSKETRVSFLKATEPFPLHKNYRLLLVPGKSLYSSPYNLRTLDCNFLLSLTVNSFLFQWLKLSQLFLGVLYPFSKIEYLKPVGRMRK